MKSSLNYTLLLLFLCASLNSHGQSSEGSTAENKLMPTELKPLIGDWKGTLTYLDYSSGEPYSMPINLKAETGKNDNQLKIFYTYPKEPKANSAGKIMLSKNGQKLNGKPITSKERLSNGAIQITTESMGKDNRQKATIRIVYYLSNQQFTMKKEVRFENTKEWIRRNEYSFDK